MKSAFSIIINYIKAGVKKQDFFYWYLIEEENLLRPAIFGYFWFLVVRF